MDLATHDLDELAAQARQTIDDQRYLTLSTADAAGRPWVTPVFFTPDGYGRFLWVSGPGARHSRNIAARPEVSFVVFDSTVAVGRAVATYVDATARQVADDELVVATTTFNRRLEEGRRIELEELQGGGPLRLFEAVATEVSVLLRGGDPRNLTGIDGRVVVRP